MASSSKGSLLSLLKQQACMQRTAAGLQPPLFLYKMNGLGNCGTITAARAMNVFPPEGNVTLQVAGGRVKRAQVAVWMTRWGIENPLSAAGIVDTLGAMDAALDALGDVDGYRYECVTFEAYATLMATDTEWVDFTWWSMFCGCFGRTVQIVQLDAEDSAVMGAVIQAPNTDVPLLEAAVLYPVVYVAHYGAEEGVHFDALGLVEKVSAQKRARQPAVSPLKAARPPRPPPALRGRAADGWA